MMKVVFCITGFTQFGSIDMNPTEVLVNRLLQETSLNKDSNLGSKTSIKKDCTRLYSNFPENISFRSVKSLEVSAQAVSDYLNSDIKSTVAGSAEEEFVIHLHLGVHGRATCIHLEQWAYNMADFRIPDVKGVQLLNQPVVLNGNIVTKPLCEETDITKKAAHQSCISRLPSKALASELQKMGYNTEATNDAGGYLCNYIYYASLSKTLQASQQCFINRENKSGQTSFFIHVPPFSVINEAEQYDTLCDFIKLAAHCVEKGNLKPLDDSLGIFGTHEYCVGHPEDIKDIDTERLHKGVLPARDTNDSGI